MEDWIGEGIGDGMGEEDEDGEGLFVWDERVFGLEGALDFNFFLAGLLGPASDFFFPILPCKHKSTTTQQSQPINQSQINSQSSEF